MNIFSPNFLILFAIAVLVITLRARSKKKGSSILPGKQIAIIGRKIETPLTKNTPCACLLVDGHKYGDGFRDKKEPELPHNEACQCTFSAFVQRNYDIFTRNPLPDPPRVSDLGELSPSAARFYKYMLISHHPDATDEDRASYAELAGQVDADPDFKARVRKHLNLDQGP